MRSNTLRGRDTIRHELFCLRSRSLWTGPDSACLPVIGDNLSIKLARLGGSNVYVVYKLLNYIERCANNCVRFVNLFDDTSRQLTQLGETGA